MLGVVVKQRSGEAGVLHFQKTPSLQFLEKSNVAVIPVAIGIDRRWTVFNCVFPVTFIFGDRYWHRRTSHVRGTGACSGGRCWAWLASTIINIATRTTTVIPCTCVVLFSVVRVDKSLPRSHGVGGLGPLTALARWCGFGVQSLITGIVETGRPWSIIVQTATTMMAVVAVVVGVTVHGGSLRFLPEEVDRLPPSPDLPWVLATAAAGLKVFPSDLLLADFTFGGCRGRRCGGT